MLIICLFMHFSLTARERKSSQLIFVNGHFVHSHWCDMQLLFNCFAKIFHLWDTSYLFYMFFINIARQFTHSCSAIFPKHIHFSFIVSANLRDDRNLMLICWKETLSTFQEQTLKKLFLLFYIKIKTQNHKVMHAF